MYLYPLYREPLKGNLGIQGAPQREPRKSLVRFWRALLHRRGGLEGQPEMSPRHLLDETRRDGTKGCSHLEDT